MPNRVLAFALGGCLCGAVEAQTGDPPGRRHEAITQAVAYLAAEVPRWRPENGCFSCHNNGDGARALLVARGSGFEVPPAALSGTVDWLRRPERWQRQAGDQPFKDGKLAAVQFAAAQSAARAAGQDIGDRSRQAAAEQLLSLQAVDGSWQLEGGGLVGSPAGYGSALATVTAYKTLLGAGETPTQRKATAGAAHWIRTQRPVNVAGAAIVLWGLGGDSHDAAVACRAHCLELLGDGQTDSGGWGPFAAAPPEPFDTALAVLALSQLPAPLATPELLEMRLRGERFLIDSQLDGGGWPETTRPAGGESYAQHISTTGWAALALLASREAERSDATAAAKPSRSRDVGDAH